MARKKKSETTAGDLKSLIESGNWKLVLLIIVASVIYFLFQPGGYEVVRVVDGDTLVVKIDGEEEKVRLIGVNTPESTTKKLLEKKHYISQSVLWKVEGYTLNLTLKKKIDTAGY